jgi:GNAT superfamily N-acetyltransferase
MEWHGLGLHEGTIVITYTHLNKDRVAEMVLMYEDFYLEVENENMDDARLEEFQLTLIKHTLDPEYLFLIALDNDELIGFRFLTPVKDGLVKTVAANGIYVAPTHRNKGIAKRLFDLSKEWAHQHDCVRILMWQPYKNGKWLNRNHFGFKPYKVLMTMEV